MSADDMFAVGQWMETQILIVALTVCCEGKSNWLIHGILFAFSVPISLQLMGNVVLVCVLVVLTCYVFFLPSL